MMESCIFHTTDNHSISLASILSFFDHLCMVTKPGSSTIFDENKCNGPPALIRLEDPHARSPAAWHSNNPICFASQTRLLLRRTDQ